MVFEDICSRLIDDRCVENLFDYLRQVSDDNFIATNESVKNKIREDIHRKITKEFIDSVIVKENLNEKEIRELGSLTE